MFSPRRTLLADHQPRKRPFALHPQALAGYRKLLADISPLIGSDQTGTREAAEALRRIVKTVTVGPGATPDQIEITIEGHLRELIEAPPVRVGGAVVARGRDEQTPQLLACMRIA